MKATFTVTPRLRAGDGPVGLDQVVTPMLMLTKFSGMNLSADLKRFLAGADGRISDELSSSGFKGEVGEHLTITLGEKSKQKRVLFVGLGKAGSFNCGTVRDTIKVAINRAVAARVERISILVMPNRLTSSSLGLTPTAHIIKCVAEDVLEAKKGDGTLEVELVCTPQAQRHVKAGIAQARRQSATVCESAGKAPAKKDACTRK